MCALVLIDTPPPAPDSVANVLWLGAPYWVPPKGTLLCGVLGGRGQKWDSSCLCFLTLWPSEKILMELSRVTPGYRNVQDVTWHLEEQCWVLHERNSTLHLALGQSLS